MRSKYLSDILTKIEYCITTKQFQELETDKIELKDLSSGSNWESLRQTICAFLNSDGGYVICGIREENPKQGRKYLFTGFNNNDEDKLLELQNKYFYSDKNILENLENYIHSYIEPFMSGNIAIVWVEALPQDKKFVKYKNTYFERMLTQDKKISASKIQQQREYKAEIEYARELVAISGAVLDDLSLDKINNYVTLLNREIRKETLKASIESAQTFLAKQYFIQGEQITTLGMLVCGEDPFRFLANRAAVDCYYDTSSDVSRDRKLFANDVLHLMDESFRYVWGHIKVGRSVRDGGREMPEYPENLIREIINNALAHRDYTIDKPVTIKVEPNRFVEIKNPGSFKEKIKILYGSESNEPIRRLISGMPESKNPKLAFVLKVFDKIESQGRGMAALMNATLANLIDLPYYELGPDTIRLIVPTGQLVDEAIETWLSGFEQYITNNLLDKLTDDHKAVLAYFYKSELLNRQNRYTILLSEGNNHFGAINELERAKLIVKHPASTEFGTIYVLDRVLMKIDFRQELVELLGRDYIEYHHIAKGILNMVYLFSKYNHKALKASDITPQIYRNEYGKQVVGRQYETLGRQVRKHCNLLEQRGILIKNEKGAYTLNFDFQASAQLI